VPKAKPLPAWLLLARARNARQKEAKNEEMRQAIFAARRAAAGMPAPQPKVYAKAVNPAKWRGRTQVWVPGSKATKPVRTLARKEVKKCAKTEVKEEVKRGVKREEKKDVKKEEKKGEKKEERWWKPGPKRRGEGAKARGRKKYREKRKKERAALSKKIQGVRKQLRMNERGRGKRIRKASKYRAGASVGGNGGERIRFVGREDPRAMKAREKVLRAAGSTVGLCKGKRARGMLDRIAAKHAAKK
jgi:hypothetical protein